MSETKWFAFHWKDGSTTYSKGRTVSEAASISIGGLRALDYYEEPKELPDKFKEVHIVYPDGSDDFIVSWNTMLYEKIHSQLLEGKTEVTAVLCGKEYKYKVTKSNYEYTLEYIMSKEVSNE